MSLKVLPYQEISSNIVTYNDINYDIKSIPDIVQVRFDTMTEETELLLMSLINSSNPSEQQKLRTINNCISQMFNEKLNIRNYYNEFTPSVLEVGTGMDFISEDRNKYGDKIIVINIGSGITMTLVNKLTNKPYNIYLPRRSMILLNDDKYQYKRTIKKTVVDEIDGKIYQRGKRYGILFRHKK